MDTPDDHRTYPHDTQVPTLYVGRVEDLLWRVPLFPCYLNGNPTGTSTIPHKYAARQKQAYEFGCADGQGPALRRAAGVAMFMRSTRGCRILDGLSLELEDFRSLKRKGSAGRPGRTLPRALGRPGGPESVLLRRYDVDKHGIYQSYTWYTQTLLQRLIKKCFTSLNHVG